MSRSPSSVEHLSYHGRLVITFLLCLAPFSTAALGDPTNANSLLFLDTRETCPNQTDLAECRRLTVQRYRELGYTVNEVEESQFDAWLAQEGSGYKNAIRDIQRIAFARSRHADVIGGIAYDDPPKPTSEWMFDNGPQFHGWSINLRSCYCAGNYTPRPGDGTEVRAIPLLDSWYFTTTLLRHVRPGSRDVWRLPNEIEGVTSLGTVTFGSLPLDKQRAILGVRFRRSSWDVEFVTPDTPAEKAGIRAGDTLIAIGEEQLQGRDPCRPLLETQHPGDEVPVTWIHEGQRTEQTIRLGSDEFMWQRQHALIGRPLPDLSATKSDGTQLRLSEFRGRVVVLSIGGWHGERLPVLQMLSDRYGPNNIVWLIIDTDELDKPRGSFIEDNHLSALELKGPDWSQALNLWNSPVDYLVDQNGVLRRELNGFRTAQEVASLIQEVHEPANNRRQH